MRIVSKGFEVEVGCGVTVAGVIVGAALAALVLLPFLTTAVLGWILAGVAGIMVAIALDELVPAAKSFGSAHTPILGVITGMLVMAVSLWLLK